MTAGAQHRVAGYQNRGTAAGIIKSFGTHNLTVELVSGEMKRLGELADKLEWESVERVPGRTEPVVVPSKEEAARLVRNEIGILSVIKTNLLAGQAPVSEFEEDKTYDTGALIRDGDVVWQATKRTGHPPQHQFGHWKAIVGTPPAAPAARSPMSAVVDRKLPKAGEAKDAEDEEYWSAVRSVFNDFAEGDGLDAEHLKRPPSTRYVLVWLASLTAMVSKVNSQVGDNLESHIKRLDDLEKRVAAFEGAGLKYQGVWQRASSGYRRGSVVTHQGSAWIALKDHGEGEQPGMAPDAWHMLVKAGRDAR